MKSSHKETPPSGISVDRPGEDNEDGTRDGKEGCPIPPLVLGLMKGRGCRVVLSAGYLFSGLTQGTFEDWGRGGNRSVPQGPNPGVVSTGGCRLIGLTVFVET